MILRLLPYVFAFGFGFVLAMMVFNRRGERQQGGELQEKYHALQKRFRDLTAQLSQQNGGGDVRVGRLRRALREVQGLLHDPARVSEARARDALEAAENALEETT